MRQCCPRAPPQIPRIRTSAPSAARWGIGGMIAALADSSGASDDDHRRALLFADYGLSVLLNEISVAFAFFLGVAVDPSGRRIVMSRSCGRIARVARGPA